MNHFEKYISKTKSEAVEFLTSKGATDVEEKTARCGCGESHGVKGYDEDYNLVGVVAICENCGEDL